MIYKFSTSLRSNIVTQILSLLDAGAGPGTIKIYNGTMPTGLGAIASQVLLATLTLPDPAGTVTDGALTFGAITEDSSADATGTATWARLADSDGNAVMDLDVTGPGGGGAVEINTTSIIALGPVFITSFVITAGGA